MPEEGEGPDCPEQAEANSTHAIDPAEASEPEAGVADAASPHAIKTAATDPTQQVKPAADAKPAKRSKSRSARSRRLPFFLRKVDVFGPSGR